jgi:glutamate---cysteine ligase / carboxylate-amine ligase
VVSTPEKGWNIRTWKVETETRAWQQDAAPLRMRAELLRLAAWRASRSGLDGQLVDPRTGRAGPRR